MLEDLTPTQPTATPPDPAAGSVADSVGGPLAADQAAVPGEDGGQALLDWKQALREDFEQWLDSLDEIPEPEAAEDDPGTTPDLYSFHEQFAAANAETRKAHRRTAEAISLWGDTLARFEAGLTPLRETVAQLTATQAPEGRLSRTHCLVLVEWLDRLRRVTQAFESPPPKRRWWESDGRWTERWAAQRQALGIVVSHLEEFLRREGVTRLEALGQSFDPITMAAVAAELDPTRPTQTVLEEIAPGYRRQGELLRPAQVKVSRRP